MNKEEITNVGWFKQGTSLPVDGFLIAQVTLKTASTGTWNFILNPTNVANVLSGTIEGEITNGNMSVTNVSYSLNGPLIQ